MSALRAVGAFCSGESFSGSGNRRGAGVAATELAFGKSDDTPGDIEVTEDGVTVWLPKRAHNPILIAAGVLEAKTEVPWWEGKKLQRRLTKGTKMLGRSGSVEIQG
jgi:hypothetical protein